MPTLLEDLAAESSASNRRVAARLDEERRRLSEPQPASSAQQQSYGVMEAQQATDDAMARMMQAEGLWRSALTKLREAPTADAAVALLRTLLQAFESGDELVQSVRALRKEAERFGATADGFEELDRADAWFKQRITDTKKAIEHRIHPWQPSDPERFALGLKLAREGKTISADEMIARFRRAGS